MTALLLQLVQSCAHGVSQQIRGRRLRDETRMIVDGQPHEVDGPPQSSADAEQEVSPSLLLPRPCLNQTHLHLLLAQEAQIYTASCEAAARIAKSIASFLTVSCVISVVSSLCHSFLPSR